MAIATITDVSSFMVFPADVVWPALLLEGRLLACSTNSGRWLIVEWLDTLGRVEFGLSWKKAAFIDVSDDDDLGGTRASC